MRGSTIRRVFIVGCSRSGTTLLQGLLANHSRVHTFPETGVFLKAFGMRGRVLPWVHLGITLGKERKALAKLLSSQMVLAQKGLPQKVSPQKASARQPSAARFPALPPRRLSLSRSLREVGEFMDSLAEAHGKDVWVEKTPRHVFHARRIQRAVPGSCCIHIIRQGHDVVASMVDRARRFPGRFPRQQEPSYGIQQWNRSMKATAKASREPGHVVVVFEELVQDVEETLVRLGQILGLEYEPEMATPADPSSFTDPSEAWKAQAAEPVRKAASKFQDIFSEEEQARILGRLNMDLYEGLRARARKAPGRVLSSGSAKP